MRKLLCALFLLLSLTCLAQPGALHFNNYSERRDYISGLLGRMYLLPYLQIRDTLRPLVAAADAGRDEELAGELRLTALVLTYSYGNSPDDSIERRLKELAFEASKKGLPYLEADALQSIGDFYLNKKHQRSAAIDQYIAAYEFYKNFDGRDYTIKQVYICALGGEFYRLDDFDNALRYFWEAKQLMFSTKLNMNLYCSMFNTIGLCHRHAGRYDSAIYYFTKTYERAVEEKNKPYIGIALGNIGITYFRQKKYAEAEPLLKKDIENSLATRQLKNAVNTMATLATIYNEQQRYLEADTLLRHAINIIHEKNFWSEYLVNSNVFRQMYVLLSASKDFREAARYADSAMIAKDSATAQNSAVILAKAHDKLEYVQRKLESEKLESQVSLARVELSKNRIMMLFAVGGVGILLIVMLFIVRLNNKVKTQNHELEKLNAVKDRIFSIVGHDLRAPVNSLVSFTQLLEHGEIAPERMQRYMGVLKETLGHTAGLMENLLNWARTQMKGYNPVSERFDLHEAATQCVGLLSQDAGKKGVVLVNEIPATTTVMADFNMVALLLRNLVSNAIKYTPAGGSVTLSAAIADGKISITVSDTGVGIDQKLVREFNATQTGQPLFSTPGTNKEKGTGLGLMLCKDFAGLMNGKLQLESEPGKGSRVTLALPA